MPTEQLSAAPSLPPLMVKAILTAPTRRGGELPDTELALDGVRADHGKLADYARVCGFRVAPTMPGTYPHILGFPLAMRLMTDTGFPFPLPGMVHYGNRITQHKPVPTEAELSLRVRAGNLTATERGVRFGMFTEAYAGGELLWDEESQYLHLSKGGGPRSDGKRGEEKPEAPTTPTAVWRVGGDIGRRYAAVSGDHNPIHLHPVAAKLAGFRKPIAHGMWTLARCLSALEGRLPEAYTIEVEFRKPITLPSTVGFAATREGAGWRVGVHDRDGVKTYVSGAVTP